MRKMTAKKNILITGCSSGIGEHCAKSLLARGGWRIFAAARKSEDAKRLQDSGMESLQLNLDDSASIRTAAEFVADKTGGRIDALFNNGAFGQPGAVEDLSREALRAQFETNVFGTQELTNIVAPLMRKQGGGRIVYHSSMLGFVSLPYRGAYNASKHALESLADTMRMELRGSGIHLSLIEPGPISSRFRENAMRHFHRHINSEKSPHREFYLQMQSRYDSGKPSPFTLGPSAVFRALIHALENPSPKIRYQVTTPAKLFWWLRRGLPIKWLDSALIRGA